VRKGKPQGRRGDADEEFGHRQPPLRPRGQPRLRPAVLIAKRRFGSVLRRVQPLTAVSTNQISGLRAVRAGSPGIHAGGASAMISSGAKI
jgi:hypothetical protein